MKLQLYFVTNLLYTIIQHPSEHTAQYILGVIRKNAGIYRKFGY